MRALILSASFYPHLADMLEADARAVLAVARAEVSIRRVPGAFELPTALAIALEKEREQGAPADLHIALGAVIRGQTSHYDLICASVTRELQRLAAAHRLAFGFGLVTAENMRQAAARADPGGKHRTGARAAEAALTLRRHAAEGFAPAPEDGPEEGPGA